VVAPTGRLALISGQAAVDRQGKVMGKGDIKVQVRQTLEDLKAVWERADNVGHRPGSA
jgi:enamine deaminase RidA (YjgF/YER057c/UK114 family)